MLLAFGKFDYLGWISRGQRIHPPTAARRIEPRPTRSCCKFMVVAALLFLAQTLIGGGVAHYRAEPGDFYGIDLADLPEQPAAHLASADSRSSGSRPPMSAARCSWPACWAATSRAGQRRAIHLLFGAIVIVAVGSLLGEWAGILQLLGKAWFWFGNQGWEYLEIGRAWQILLAIGLVVLVRPAVAQRGAGAARSRAPRPSSCSS